VLDILDTGVLDVKFRTRYSVTIRRGSTPNGDAAPLHGLIDVNGAVDRSHSQDEKEKSSLNRQFFAKSDGEVAGPPRELVGYGEHPPKIDWPNGARVAVQIVVNYEEGSEKTYAMGDATNDIMSEVPGAVEGQRDLNVESVYEYGSRAGIWRLFRVFDHADIPVTLFATAVALERNPDVAKKATARRDEVAAHGYRWSNQYEMTAEEEREAIRLAVASIQATTGSRPVGWYSREMSVNTRDLVVEEGGFIYDSECYNDDLPYWTLVRGKPHLVVPYTLTVNDVRYILGTGYGSPDHFFESARSELDRLRNDGDDVNRMMSIGLHPRITGRPSRSDGLARFIDYAQNAGDVWIARRADIATTFRDQYPAERAFPTAAIESSSN
jgi:peptidoglycan/xylan/chitin deacetylase (PgdA/CDA1 family)